MVVIPAGSFEMGSNLYSIFGTEPAHPVTILEPFAIGVYEVTFEEWDACVRENGCLHRPDDDGWGRGNRPVVRVNKRDVAQYLKWISTKTGRAYRLPSSAEWEYAARAGTATLYFWGEWRDTVGRAKANCLQCGGPWQGKGTAPVGSFEPNAFGLYDTSGNVAEWVADCYHRYYWGAPSDGRAWVTRCYSERGVTRGGSWGESARDVGLLKQTGVNGDDRTSGIGFRVAKTL